VFAPERKAMGNGCAVDLAGERLALGAEEPNDLGPGRRQGGLL
jgi:hypothetical protein